MSGRFSQRMTACFRGPDEKRRFNEELFTEVAPKYDFVTRALSMGRDGAWKQKLIAALPESPKPKCVDLACGTGDLCGLLAERYPRGTVIGIDLTESMLAIARQRFDQSSIDFRTGDMAALELANGDIDIVTGSYALRNAPDVAQALNEAARILKPGGVAAFLDFSKPANRQLSAIEYGVLKLWGSFWGLCLHHSPPVYGYIAESLRHFPNRRELRKLAGQAGFELQHTQQFYCGILELLVLQRKHTTKEDGDA